LEESYSFNSSHSICGLEIKDIERHCLFKGSAECCREFCFDSVEGWSWL